MKNDQYFSSTPERSCAIDVTRARTGKGCFSWTTKDKTELCVISVTHVKLLYVLDEFHFSGVKKGEKEELELDNSWVRVPACVCGGKHALMWSLEETKSSGAPEE